VHRKDLKFSETFETVSNRLPILRDILQTCHEHFEPIKTSLPADTVQGLVKTVDNCKRRAEKITTTISELLLASIHLQPWSLAKFSINLHQSESINPADH
jgi:N-terminal domain on NACHT_NTPase and P-loop NTPases